MTAHTVIYAPIGQATRSEQVVERLGNAIIAGLLEANEQLPNEADLSRLMGVSPVTVREALNTLRVKGLIDTRRGRNGGSFVCELSANQVLQQQPLRQVSNEYLADLSEFHSAILSHSAKLATQRTTSQQLNKLHELILVFQNAEQPDIRAQTDMRCLLTLVAYAQSSRLANHELAIQTEWLPLVATLYKNDKIHLQTVAQYLKLFACLQQQDAEAAAQQAQNLLYGLTDEMLEYKLTL